MKTKTLKRRVSSVMMAIVIMISTMLALTLQASAATTKVNAFDVPTSSKYCKTYVLSTNGTTIPYTSKDLSTRGTVTNGKANGAYIDNKTDLIYLLDAGINSKGKAWAKVSYPTSKKRLEAYIPLSAITSASYSKSQTSFKSTGKFTCAARKGGANDSSIYVAKGDTVYVLYEASSSGNNVQIMYPVSTGWRIAWTTKANITKYGGGSDSSSSSTKTSTSSTYSISSDNVLTLLGVKMDEYKIGDTFENGQYANVNGKRVYTAASQCMGYACYIELKLYGYCVHSDGWSHFSVVSGSDKVKPKNADALKALITKAGVGAHIRTDTTNKDGHSMIIIEITDTGFTIVDANGNKSKHPNGIYTKTYTWSSYLNSDLGQKGLYWIKVYKK